MAGGRGDAISCGGGNGANVVGNGGEGRGAKVPPKKQKRTSLICRNFY